MPRPSPSRLPFALGVGVILALVGWLVVSEVFFGIDRDGAPTSGMVALDVHPQPPPLRVRVRGTESISSLDDPCRGYVPELPLLVLRLSEPGTVTVRTSSSTDTVLALLTADGQVYCDDDSGGSLDALLSVPLGAGDHRVWVGTYHEDVTADVEVHVDRRGPNLALDLVAPPSHGALGAEEPPVRGQTRGVVPARTAERECPGHLPVAPTATLSLAEPAFVELSASGEGDLVMFVLLSDGRVRCDDDSAGELMPRVSASMPAGEHRIWVGTYRLHAISSFTLTAAIASE